MPIIKFLFLSFFLYYVPGHLITRYMKLGLKNYERAVVSLSLGIFIVPQAYYYLEAVKLHNIFLSLVILCSVVVLLYKVYQFLFSPSKKLDFNIYPKRDEILAVIITVMVSVIAIRVIGTSGLIYPDGMRFYQANAYDSVAQLAMVNELSKNPPHEFPFYSGIPLKGYYIGSFYWRALLQKITSIKNVDLFFRFSPLFLFVVIVMMTYICIKRLSKNVIAATLGIFLIFLMSDLSWIFPLADRLLPSKTIQSANFSGSLLNWMMFNPPFAHGMFLFFISCYLLKYAEGEKDSKKLLVPLFLAGLAIGALFEYKAFMWATLFPALILTGIKEYIFDKRSLFLKISLIVALFSAASFFRISSGQALSLFEFSIGYYPILIFKDMGISMPQTGPTLFMIIGAFLFFIMGVLGIKIVGFYKVYLCLKEWKRLSSVSIFLILAMALSFILTNIFILNSDYTKATYNFFAVFLLVMSIFAGEVVADWVTASIPLVRASIFMFLVIIGIGSTAFSFLAYFPNYSKYKLVTKDVLEAVDYIKKSSPGDAVILNNPASRPWIFEKTHSKLILPDIGRDSFISALTARKTVNECIWHMKISDYAPDLVTRRNDVNLFFKTKDRDKAKAILTKYSISYVWVGINDNINFSKDGILKEIFSNKEITIYKVLSQTC